MISIDLGQTELLFSRFDLSATLTATRDAALADASAVPATAAATDSELEELARAIAARHSITVPTLLEADAYATQERRRVDVSGDPSRMFFGETGPVFVDMDAIVFHVPFTGERELFFARASTFTMNPPRAQVDQSEVRIALLREGDADAAEIRRVFAREVSRIVGQLEYVCRDVGPDWEARTFAQVLDFLTVIRNRQASTRQIIAELGFKAPPATPSRTADPATADVEAQPHVPLPEQDFAYDFFLSHASEDKDEVARPLFDRLSQRHRVWFDEAEIKLGDSLTTKIDEGLAKSRFGIVVMSRRFFQKQWTNAEMQGLRSRGMSGGTSILLPVWVDVDATYLLKHHPPLADLKAVLWSSGLDAVVREIERAYGP